MKNGISLVMAILFVTKLLGLLKIRLFAAVFGTSRELDIFWAAFTIPDMLFTIIAAGSMSAAIIPVFTTVLYRDGEHKLVRLLSTVTVILGLVSLSLITFMNIFAEKIAAVFIDSQLLFSSSAAAFTDTDRTLFIQLLRILLFSQFFLTVSSLITAYLQVHKRFFIINIAPFLYNVGIIIGTLIFSRLLGMGVQGIAWSVVLGSFMHAVVQLPAFLELTNQFNLDRFKIDIIGFWSDIVKMFKLALPRFFAYTGEQLNVLINTGIGLTLPVGSLSAYKYAFSLHLFPAQIFGGAIAQFVMPDLSAMHAENDSKNFRNILNDALTRMMLFIMPAVTMLFVLRLPAIRIMLGSGAFDLQSTSITAWCLGLLVVSIVGQSIVGILLRAFYAVHETRLPLLVTAIAIVINVLCSYFFTNFFSNYDDWRDHIPTLLNSGDLFGSLGFWFTHRGDSAYAVGGLAFSMSFTYFIETILNFALLNTKIKVISWHETIEPMIKILASSLMMGGTMYIFYKVFDIILDTRYVIQLLVLTGGVAFIGMIVYYLCIKQFNFSEFDFMDRYFEVIRRISHKFFFASIAFFVTFGFIAANGVKALIAKPSQNTVTIHELSKENDVVSVPVDLQLLDGESFTAVEIKLNYSSGLEYVSGESDYPGCDVKIVKNERRDLYIICFTSMDRATDISGRLALLQFKGSSGGSINLESADFVGLKNNEIVTNNLEIEGLTGAKQDDSGLQLAGATQGRGNNMLLGFAIVVVAALLIIFFIKFHPPRKYTVVVVMLLSLLGAIAALFVMVRGVNLGTDSSALVASPSIESEYYKCSVDSDCVVSSMSACCSCASGGEPVAVNKAYSSPESRGISCSQRGMCAAQFRCEDGVPTCVNNRCELTGGIKPPTTPTADIDLNDDGRVSLADYSAFISTYIRFKTDGTVANPKADLVKESTQDVEKIDIRDYNSFIASYLEVKSAAQ